MALSPNALQPFIWGRGGAALTPEQVAREREIAEALVAQGIDTSPVGHWTQGAARMANVLAGKIREGRAASAESAGRAAYNERLSGLFGGAPMSSTTPQLGGSPATSTAMATMPAPANAAVARNTETGGDWLQYANQGATRNLTLNDRLVQAMSFLPELGVTMKVVSGGQVGKGEKGRRVGSTRHDHGNAADVDFYIGDRKLTPKNEADRAILAQIVQRGKAAGVTGWGEGDDYMGSGRVHLGFGNPGVWGAGGKGANAPEWLRQAYNTPYTPASAVAANEAMATGQLANAAQPSSAALSTAVQGYAPIVAETPEAIMAAEAAMMDPAFAGTGRSDRLPAAEPAMAPSLPEPRMIDDLPVADIARSLTGATLADDRVPMAGGASSFAPVGTQAPNVSLPAGAQFTLPPPQQQVAQSLAQGGGQPSMQQLIELASDPWATPAQRQVVGALLQHQMDAADPYRQAQLEKLRLETEALRNPAAPKLINAGDGRLYDPGTGQWIVAPDMGTAKPSEAEARIARLTENLMATGDFLDPREAQNIATGIVDGRLRADRHPITGVLQVVDMATGQPAYQQGSAQPSAGDAMTAPQTTMPSGQFGQQFPNAPGAFGLEGAAQGAINRASDAIGIGPVYPDVAQTQADFAVLRESLLNDMASSYGRQPPSWLLKEIRDLTPEAGSAFQGPAAAQAKLNALGRHLQGELDNTNRALQRDLSPANRQEMEARQQGLIAGLERVNGAIRAFQPQQQQQQGGDIPPAPQGVDPEDWKYMTPEERALFP